MRADTWSRGRFWYLRLLIGAVLGLMAAMCGGPLFSPGGKVARAAGTPSITIASPSSAQGPIETRLQINGAGWNPGANVQLFYNAPSNNQPCGDPNASQTLAQSQPLGTGAISVQGDGTWVLKTQWPSTNTGQFTICGFDLATPTTVIPSNQPFTVLSTSLPTLDPPTPAFPNAGDQITLTGHGFLPGNQAVDLWLTSNPSDPTHGTSLGTVTPDGTGQFTKQITLPLTQSGNLTIVAQSRPSVNGAPAPLVATIDLTIGATASTPTASPTGTATPDPTATVPAATTPTGTGTGSSSGSSTSRSILAVLLALLVLVVVAIFGVLIWYFAGIRPPAGGAPPPPSSGRTRAPVAPTRGQTGRRSQANWQQEDDWEEQQGPWEEDEQGTWGGAGQWGQGSGPNLGRSGPQSRSRPSSSSWGDDAPRPPRSRPVSRDEW
jgi:hypothetical protein